MVLKLYGFPQSTTVKTVATVLYEKKVPFEYVEVDVYARAHKEADYLEKQPFGQIPCIDDNGFILYESRAISRYLVENYPEHGDRLIPSDPKKRALFEQAVSSEAFNFDRFATPLVLELLFKKNGQTDLAKVEDLKNNLGQKLDVYDKILSKQKYLAGDSVTLADLFHLSGGQLMIKAGLTLIQDRPNVARWFNEISSRESWQMVKDGVGPCKF